MKVPLLQLERHLSRDLATSYLVAGEEPLLVDEALEQIRAAARRKGFEDRELHTTERYFDWTALETSTDNLSLFASRSILELRLPSAKPGEDGSSTIAALAERRDPDRLLLVAVPEKLGNSSRSAWVKSIDEHGVLVEIWPIERKDLPAWVTRRAAAAKLKLTAAAAQALAERVEGNLLAADQEIQRLALTAPNRESREIDEAEVIESVANNSRFDVFGLTDAVLAGDAVRAFKILAGLRAEGVHPVQISWALCRELTLLAKLDYAVRHGANIDGALMRNGVWQRRQPLVKQGLKRMQSKNFRELLTQAAQVDAALKGGETVEPWATLSGFLLAMLPAAAKA